MSFFMAAAKPPSCACFSTSTTSKPAVAASSAALRPVTPPPTTRSAREISPGTVSSGSIFCARTIPIRKLSSASICVSSSFGLWHQATCSRRFTRSSTICVSNLGSNENSEVLTRGEQAATTTAFTVPSVRSLRISASPSSPHRNGWVRHTGALYSPPATFSSLATSTDSPIEQPLQRQTPNRLSMLFYSQMLGSDGDLQGFQRRPGGVADGPRDLRWPLDAAGTVHAGVHIIDEAEFVEVNYRRQPCGLRHHPGRQNHEVVVPLDLGFVQNVLGRNLHILGCGVFFHFADLALDEFDLVFRSHLGIEVLQVPWGSQVDIEDRDLRFRIELSDVGGVLQRSRATDRRAIRKMILVARSGALHECHRARLFPVRGAQDLTAGRPVGSREPLHHHIGDDVRTPAEPQILNLRGVVGSPTSGNDHGCDP